MLLLVVGFFTLLWLFVRFCDSVVGADEPNFDRESNLAESDTSQ